MFDFYYHIFFPAAGNLSNGMTISSGEEAMMKGIFFIMTLCMLICVLRRGFSDSGLFEEERYWDSVCITLLDKLGDLIPIHRRHMLVYAKATQMDVRKKHILDLIRAIPKDVKLDAERDLCLTDVYHDSAISMLKIQFMSLLHKPKKT